MNTIKKLTESISNFFTEIAYHYEIPSSEIASTLMEINFYSLFQTLCREAEPVYAFRSYGKDDCLLNYWGEKLFPCKAILLYRMPDYVADEGRIATMHFLEVWLREDLTLAVTACFHIENRAAKYYSSYRVHKGCVWPYDEDASKLNKTVRTVIIILMIVPVVQLLCCAGVVYSLGIEDELPGLINWILGGVSLLSLGELIVGGVKLFLYEKRMDELEKKIDTLFNANNT